MAVAALFGFKVPMKRVKLLISILTGRTVDLALPGVSPGGEGRDQLPVASLAIMKEGAGE